MINYELLMFLIIIGLGIIYTFLPATQVLYKYPKKINIE